MMAVHGAAGIIQHPYRQNNRSVPYIFEHGHQRILLITHFIVRSSGGNGPDTRQQGEYTKCKSKEQEIHRGTLFCCCLGMCWTYLGSFYYLSRCAHGTVL
jgi:hypothetical protein